MMMLSDVCLTGGAPQFGGGKLMREDLVVITVEYRSACKYVMSFTYYIYILLLYTFNFTT